MVIKVKIEVNVDERIDETCIRISCKELTPELNRILAMLRLPDRQLVVIRDGETYLLDVTEVIYIESVERKTFVYTKDGVYESGLKLYELEVQLEAWGFVRVSKSCLIRLGAVRSLKSDINRRIRVTLDNGEMIIASRQYADGIKKRLGIKK